MGDACYHGDGHRGGPVKGREQQLAGIGLSRRCSGSSAGYRRLPHTPVSEGTPVRLDAQSVRLGVILVRLACNRAAGPARNRPSLRRHSRSCCLRRDGVPILFRPRHGRLPNSSGLQTTAPDYGAEVLRPLQIRRRRNEHYPVNRLAGSHLRVSEHLGVDALNPAASIAPEASYKFAEAHASEQGVGRDVRDTARPQVHERP